ncbi:MAG: hypothetical protein OXR73_26890 [Myxococcales bacterium]|nr:hypothetical protein [Myxococcales bacterium]
MLACTSSVSEPSEAAPFQVSIAEDRPVAEWSEQEREQVCGDVDAFLARVPAVRRMTCALFGLRAGGQQCEATQRECLAGGGADYRALCFRGDPTGNLSNCTARAADIEACVAGTADLAGGLSVSCSTDPQSIRDLSAPACGGIDFQTCGFAALKPR